MVGVVPGLWYLVLLIREIFVFFCGEFVSLHTYLIRSSKHGRVFIETSADRMVDEVYAQNMWISHFVFLFFLCMI